MSCEGQRLRARTAGTRLEGQPAGYHWIGNKTCVVIGRRASCLATCCPSGAHLERPLGSGLNLLCVRPVEGDPVSSTRSRRFRLRFGQVTSGEPFDWRSAIGNRPRRARDETRSNRSRTGGHSGRSLATGKPDSQPDSCWPAGLLVGSGANSYDESDRPSWWWR